MYWFHTKKKKKKKWEQRVCVLLYPHLQLKIFWRESEERCVHAHTLHTHKKIFFSIRTHASLSLLFSHILFFLRSKK